MNKKQPMRPNTITPNLSNATKFNDPDRLKGVSASAEDALVLGIESAVSLALLASGVAEAVVIARPLVSHGALVGGYPADELSLRLRDLRQLFGVDAARPLVAAPLHLREQAGLGHGEERGEADDDDDDGDEGHLRPRACDWFA